MPLKLFAFIPLNIFQYCLTPFAHFCLVLYLPFSFTVRLAPSLMAHCMFKPRINCTKARGEGPFISTIAIDSSHPTPGGQKKSLEDEYCGDKEQHTLVTVRQPQILAMPRAEHEPNHLEAQKAPNSNVCHLPTWKTQDYFLFLECEKAPSQISSKKE